MKEFSLVYYFAIFFLLLLFLFAETILVKRTRVKFPSQFYMRKDFLYEVIPALRKIVNTNSRNVYIDFSNVENASQGAYMVFLAQVEKAMKLKKNIRLYPILPKAKSVQNIIFAKKKYAHKNIEILSSKIPNTESFRTVDPDFIDEIVLELRKIGFSEYYEPFYDYLVELIGNATEHGICNRKINWWMLRYRDYQKKCMVYVFVDMGLGIIKSYKKSGLPLRYLLRTKNNIPLDALYGKLGSSTKKNNRGRGLPQIREIIEKGLISDFILITNSVSLRYIDNEFIVSENPNFIGTYFSWTINKDNYITWKNTQ